MGQLRLESLAHGRECLIEVASDEAAHEITSDINLADPNCLLLCIGVSPGVISMNLGSLDDQDEILQCPLGDFSRRRVACEPDCAPSPALLVQTVQNDDFVKFPLYF